MRFTTTLKNVAINLLLTKRKNRRLTSSDYKIRNRKTLFLCFILLCFCYDTQAYFTIVHTPITTNGVNPAGDVFAGTSYVFAPGTSVDVTTPDNSDILILEVYDETTAIINMMVDIDGDKDDDGINDCFDLDSDNNGISDLVESGFTNDEINNEETDRIADSNALVACSDPPVEQHDTYVNNHWVVGATDAIDWSSGAPVVTARTSQAGENIASYSDPLTGALLFTTNGINILDVNGDEIFTGLSANPSTGQSTVIIPVPGTTDQFYIIGNSADVDTIGAGTLSIAQLDGSLGFLMGEATVTLLSPPVPAFLTSEALAIAPSTETGCGCEYWLLSFHNNVNSIAAFRVTATGVDWASPVISTVTFPAVPLARGHIMFSPDYSQLSYGNFGAGVGHANFNTDTGVISGSSGDITGPVFNQNGYAGILSPDGTKLYYTEGTEGFLGAVREYDIVTTLTTAFGGSSVAGYRYGPDANIYISKSASTFMDRINFPFFGPPAYEANAVSLGATGTHWPGNPTVVKPGAGCFAVPPPTDTDNDGIEDAIDIDDDNDGILDIAECPPPLGSPSPIIYFNDSRGRIIEYNVDTGIRTSICTGLTLYGDIAISTDGVMYGIDGFTNALDIIDLSDCSITNVSTSYAGNALSFIPDGNMLEGQAADSIVYKIDVVGATYVQTVWHDFGAGGSNGDFIFLNGKIYILWFDSAINPTDPLIYEVTVDASYNYVSHINLGSITRFTFGLAKAKGKLYGVAARGFGGMSPPGELFEIPLPGLTPTTLIHTEANNLFGATSPDEGFLGLCDTDSDGIADPLDLDSDNDGISDLTESGFANPQYDLNNDGTISIAEAEAVLGADNADIDNDGLLDIFDADTGSTDPTLSAGTTPDDFDSDAIANHLDLDSDADGIADTIEAFPTAGYTTNDGDVTDNDADGDGIIDLFDSNDLTTGDFGGTFSTPENTDGVGNQDYLDTNSDNDALLDSAESGLTLSAVDANGDGIDDDASIGASYSDPDGVIDTPSTDLANEFGDTSEVGYREAFIPIILTQYYENGTERWIEVTNVDTSPIPASNYKIAFFNQSIPDPDGATPTATYDISGAIPAGASLLIHASVSNSGTPPSSGTLVIDDGVTNFDGDDRLALTTTTDNTAWASRVDAIGDGSIGTNRSLVRIDEVSSPNAIFTPSEWINFLDPADIVHPHDPLRSEVDTGDVQANNRLGVHNFGCTTYTGGSFDNGLYDRSRCVIIDQDNSHTGGLEARTLEVTTGNTLTMTTDDLLVVTNSITLDGDIVLSGDAQLIQTHTGANQVSGNGELLRDQQGNGLTPSEFRYSYWGAPVVTPGTSTYSIGDVMRDAGNPGTPMTWVTGFNGANQATSPITQSSFWLFTFLDAAVDYSSWVSINNNTQLAPATGYTMKNPGSSVQNYTFRGTPNDGVYTHSITAGNRSLLSNPYPSALSVAQFIADNLSITGTLYVWEQWSGDSHNLALYEGGYHSVTGVGSVPPAMVSPLINPATNVGESVSSPGLYIPVGQGFFVEGGAGGTVTFNNGQREFQQEDNNPAGNGAFLRNANENTNPALTPDTEPRFFLDFSNMDLGITRRLLTAFSPNNTLGFDRGFDGIKKRDDNDFIDAWFTIQNRNEGFVILAPGAFNEDLELSLEIHVGSDGDYRFSVDEVLNFTPTEQSIYLRNNLTNKYYDLRQSDATITLSVGVYSDLYSIVFKESTLGIDELSEEENMFTVYTSSNELVIHNKGTQAIKNVTAYNILGQTVKVWENKSGLTTTPETRIPLGRISSGVYLYHIQLDSGVVLKNKFIVRQR